MVYPKTILQLIAGFTSAEEFYLMKDEYDLCVDIFMEDRELDLTTFPVEGSYKFTDHLVEKKIVTYKTICDYAIANDDVTIIKYLFDRKYDFHIDDDIMPTIPKIVKYAHDVNLIRLSNGMLDYIFINNCVELMKIFQNDDRKSDVTVEDYLTYHNDLYKLNYKHKMMHVFHNYGLHILFSCHIGLGVYIGRKREPNVTIIIKSLLESLLIHSGYNIIQNHLCDKLLPL